MSGHVHVAVAVIVDGRGNVLIARRHEDQHQGGLWEFPGGKVEPGESVPEALARELREEIGCEAPLSAMVPLMKIPHDYPDKSVLLDVWWVRDIVGLPEGREEQEVRWTSPDLLCDYAFPAANGPIIEAVMRALVPGFPGE